MEPWSRQECAKMVEEAGDRILSSTDVSSEVDGLYVALAKEFVKDSKQLGREAIPVKFQLGSNPCTPL